VEACSASWEEQHGAARDAWENLADEFESFYAEAFGCDEKTDLQEDDDAESFWARIEEWVGVVADR
jgi:hypothetical protein